MKIIAIGRNYVEHAHELNNPVPSKEPVIFMKPDTALLHNNDAFFYPNFSSDIHYELEVVVRIDKVGKSIAKEFAHRYYSEIGLGIDFTARDVQQKCKKEGLPWEKAKAFDYSAAISKFIDKEKLPPVDELNFELQKNKNIVQKGYTGNMIFSIDSLIAYISKYFTLKIGDLIYTGTPAGVGSIAIGDRFIGTLENYELLNFEIR